nr:unnamed protein product [Callosobruchus analis]
MRVVKDQSKILFFHKPSVSGTKVHKIPSSRTFAIGQQNQVTKNKAIVPCNFCTKPGHCIAKRFMFKALTPGEKYSIVRENHWCFNCLTAPHGVRSCTSPVSCTHNDEPSTVQSEKGSDTTKNVSEEGPSNSVNFCAGITDAQENTEPTVVLLPTAVVDVFNVFVKKALLDFFQILVVRVFF